ncbi:hypothetical protein Q8A73_020974 [Channa argus]|nr:hypothetical protein Q8A73_020974 [Channa argus]
MSRSGDGPERTVPCTELGFELRCHMLSNRIQATSNVSQPSEGAADAETSTEAECRGNLLQGMRQAAEQQRTAGLGRCMPGQVRMGPLRAWGGFYGLPDGRFEGHDRVHVQVSENSSLAPSVILMLLSHAQPLHGGGHPDFNLDLSELPGGHHVATLNEALAEQLETHTENIAIRKSHNAVCREIKTLERE